MKRLFSNLLAIALVLGVCGFGNTCNHKHDAYCGYNEETKTGCTHVHDDSFIKPLDNGEGPTA